MTATAYRLTNADIDYAFENRQFGIIFQPIFRLEDACPLRLEAFARWKHPGLGELPPGAFVSFFEQQGRIGELTRHLLAETLAAYDAWRSGAPSAIGVAFNLAPGDLTDDTLAEHLRTAISDAGLEPQSVTVDVPLAQLDMRGAPRALGVLKDLKSVGVRIAAEARGRAIASLREIEPGLVDDVKTGGAAILRFAKTVRGPGLSQVSELLDHARSVGACPIAVGVEDEAALGALRDLGFRAAQGNFLARPGELEGFTLAQINEVRGKFGLDALTPEAMRALVSANAEPARPETPEAKPRRKVTPKPQRKPAAPAAEEAGSSAVAKALAGTRPPAPAVDARRLQRALKRAVSQPPKAEIAAAGAVEAPPVVARPAGGLGLSGIEDGAADQDAPSPAPAETAERNAEDAPEAPPTPVSLIDTVSAPSRRITDDEGPEGRPAVDLSLLDDLLPTFGADAKAPVDPEMAFVSDLVAAPETKTAPEPEADDAAETERAADADAGPGAPEPTAAPEEAEDQINLDDVAAPKPAEAKRKVRKRYFWPRTVRKLWSEKARRPKRSARNVENASGERPNPR
ncbi:MAG: EAL domain-containing protein [Pseudomonadota bacterium]